MEAKKMEEGGEGRPWLAIGGCEYAHGGRGGCGGDEGGDGLKALELEDEVDQLELVALVYEEKENHEEPHVSSICLWQAGSRLGGGVRGEGGRRGGGDKGS